jgi:hypothetical protein
MDRAAFAAAPAFEAIELAPVAPFGTDAVLGGISPNNTLVATRPVHVPGDPTTELALLAAARRRRDRTTPVRMLASQRVVRLQPFPPGQGFSPHFKLLGAITAGRDTGSHAFELDAFAEQLAMLLSILAALEPLGYAFAPIDVAISDTAVVTALLAAAGVDAVELDRVHGTDADGGAAVLAARGLALPRAMTVADLAALPDTSAARAGRRRLTSFATQHLPSLQSRFPDVRFTLDGGRLAALSYYDGLTLMLRATDATGLSLPLGDGGFTAWTQRLLADRKERLLTSGIGLELIAKRYRARSTP